jgi:hypothetical protein
VKKQTLLLFLILILTHSFTFGQKKVATANPVIFDPVTALPTSDALILMETKRLITEAMPRALNEIRLKNANVEMDKIKSTTGINVRSIDHVAIGLRVASSAEGENLKFDGVAIAHGGFDAIQMIEAGRNNINPKPQEQKYGGKTIYVYTLSRDIKIPGWIQSNTNQIATVALSKDVLAIGSLERVRAAIDADAGRGRINPEIVALASQRKDALIGMGAVVPPGLMESLDMGTDQISSAVATIKQMYGSVGSTTTGFDMFLAARTSDASQAAKLQRSLSSMQKLSGLIRDEQLRNLIDEAKISLSNNEVQVKLDLKESDIQYLLEKLLD